MSVSFKAKKEVKKVKKKKKDYLQKGNKTLKRVAVAKLIFNCSQPLQLAMIFGKFSVLSLIFK